MEWGIVLKLNQFIEKHKGSISWKIFAYFIGFSTFLLALLWLFQAVLLDVFYRQIKLDTINNVSKEVTSVLESGDYSKYQLENYVKNQSIKNDTCILVIHENLSMYQFNPYSYCDNSRMPSKGDIYDLYQKSQPEGYLSDITDVIVKNISSDYTTEQRLLQLTSFNTITLSTVGGESVTSYLFLNAVITPLDATKDTIQAQLIYITLILILVSFIVAFVLSKRVSKPIVEMNKSAKEFAKGKYNVTFDAKGYSEINELNDTLNYAASELGKVDGMRKELIANMSHDLRTPLTMISGYGEVIRDIPGENTSENIQVIIDEANRLSTLVNDVLDLSKLQSNEERLRVEKFSITDEVLKLLNRYQTLVKKENYQIDFTYEENIMITADRVKISQVLYNLINNAIHYTGEDKMVIVKQIHQNNILRFEVIDHGQGIAQEDIHNIWDRYYKVDKVHKRASIGSGLGLSIVKEIMELHRGRYGVDSIINEGSVFWIEFDLGSNDE